MDKYYLITNVSGQKYWNRLVTIDTAPGYLKTAINLTGQPIYVNERGGWFPMSAAKVVHEVIESNKFPKLNS